MAGLFVHIFFKGKPLDPMSNEQKKRIILMRQTFNLSPENVTEKLSVFNCPIKHDESTATWSYTCYLMALLLDIKTALNTLPEIQQKITIEESRQIENGVLAVVKYGTETMITNFSDNENVPRLYVTINVLMELLNVRQYFAMHPQNSLKQILTNLLEAIFLLKTTTVQTNQYKHLDRFLERTCQFIALPEYFKLLFFIKGKKEQSNVFQTAVHHHLMDCLVMAGGFKALCAVLLPSADGSSASDDKLPPTWQCCTVLSKIIAHKGHKKIFFHAIIKEIGRYLSEEENVVAGDNPFCAIAAVHCLNKLFELPYPDIQQVIKQTVLGGFDILAQPLDIICGAIIYDDHEFLRTLELAYKAFCTPGPSDITLPSKLISPYLPLFVQLFAQFQLYNQHKVVTKQIIAIVIRCLSNRDGNELNEIVNSILFQKYSGESKSLHSNVFVHHRIHEDNNKLFALQVGSTVCDDKNDTDRVNTVDYDPSTNFVRILKDSNHNILIYDVFLHLLNSLSGCISNSCTDSTTTTNRIDLITDFADLTTAIDTKFKNNYMIINALNELIAHEPFHHQFQENPHKIVELFVNILNQRIVGMERENHQTSMGDVNETNDEIILIILSLIQEFLHKTTNHDSDIIKRLYRTLHEFNKILITKYDQSQLIQQKLANIITSLSERSTTASTEYSPFTIARTLVVESTEPHLKVYGIMEILKLLSTKDTETLTNSHAILAIAMKLLKDIDSYVFLNCIKLLVALVNVIDNTVLDTLVAEYHQDDDNGNIIDIDYRLKMGETIIKVTESLGIYSSSN